MIPVPVWLWQADGPASGARGVLGGRAEAMDAAAGRLLSGAATSASVEEAVPSLWVRGLDDGYHPIARWEARVGPGRRVWWVPAKPAPRAGPGG